MNFKDYNKIMFSLAALLLIAMVVAVGYLLSK